MEKCVDSDYLQPENEAAQASKNATCGSGFSLSYVAEEENKCKDGCKVSRVDQKIASQERSSSPPNPVYNGTRRKPRRHRSGTKVNVLNKRVTEAARQSVQKETKIIKSNVPDRLEKYVSYSVRCETKSSSNEPSGESTGVPKEESEARDGYTETKIALLGNECLSNKEADRLRNSFESDLETKNIFENFFDECLDSTSKRKGVSSQESVNRESLAGSVRESERTPEKRITETPPSGAPVKVRDHSNYYRSHKNIRHVCEYCHKIFKSNGKLNSHVYSHTGERPFDCSHCGKAFSSKFKLVRHLLIHSEVRKFVCQICDRTFLRNDHLKNHYKVHDPQKKMYKCPKENCDKEYSSIMSHKKHMAYHNVEDGDLKCLICNVKYETKEEVLYHLKSHSGSRLFKTQSDKKFKCEFCDRLFLTRKDVTRHLVVHTGERDFLCQFCPQRFGRKDHLVRHIKKSHRNEDLVGNEQVKPAKLGAKSPGDTKSPSKASKKPPTGKTPEPATPTKETNTQTEDNKTHILITVQGKALQNRKKHKLHKKPFQKNESLVPKKKQVPLPKGKNQTTQILLQNIPNILIIPNNSIILLRNQASDKKGAEDSNSADQQTDLSPSVPPQAKPNQILPSSPLTPSPTPISTPTTTPSQPPNPTDFINFNYDTNIFSDPPFLPEFPEPEPFECNFHPDLPPFTPNFEPDFDIPTQTDLLSRPDMGLPTDALPNPGLLPVPPQPPTAPPAKPDREKPDPHTMEKGLFEDGSEALMLNESILNEFKDDPPATLPTDNDVAILGNILNQSNDNCGFELLRHLLTTENPVLSPLPGFSQIFHNSNANSN